MNVEREGTAAGGTAMCILILPFWKREGVGTCVALGSPLTRGVEVDLCFCLRFLGDTDAEDDRCFRLVVDIVSFVWAVIDSASQKILVYLLYIHKRK